MEDRRYLKGIVQLDKDDNIISIFESSYIAAEQLGFPKKGSGIGACCMNRQKTSCGFKWKYKY